MAVAMLMRRGVIQPWPPSLARQGSHANGVPDHPVQESGWNSWSRAIEALEEDTFIAFTVNATARAVFAVGLGENGSIGEPIRSYTHGPP